VHVRFHAAARAALTHLFGCFLVASIVGLLVFYFWYPFPYGSIDGGGKLFLIAISVDIVCGPLLTAIVFDPKKKKKELVRDLLVIAILQFSALIYGLHVVAISRPVFLAFERDRFRVVSAVEINQEDLPKALLEYQSLSLRGPRLVAVQVPTPNEPGYLESLELSLSGIETSVRPSLWRPYEEQRELVKRQLQSLSQLKLKRKENEAKINKAIKDAGLSENFLGYLPLVSRRGSGWIALVSRDDARVVGFVEVDGFL